MTPFEIPKTRFHEAPTVGLTGLLAIAVSLWWWSGGDLNSLLVPGTSRIALITLLIPWTCVVSALPHVDVVHLIFNLYWLWIFGSAIETKFGSTKTLGMMLVLAIVSSAAQYAFSSAGVGLSGVGYGLFGFLLIRGRDDESLRLDRQTVQLFVFWFFLCVVLTMQQVWNVGNVAHGAGALAGLLLGWSVAAPTAMKRALARLGLATGSILVAASVVLGLFGVVSASGPASMIADQGFSALENGDDERAAELYVEALKLDEGQAEWWYNLGIAYERLSRNREAAEAYHRSHELDPDDATALAAWKQALAAEAWAADKLGEAIRLQSEAVHFDNTDSVSWYFLALYYEEAGQTQAAIDAIREAVELEPDDAEYRELLAELQNPGPMILE